jgi:hypothetical protein
MIPKVKEHNLIYMFLYISDLYNSELKFSCQRFSNNANPAFSDEEIMTIYLFAMTNEQKFKIKQIHQYAKEYLKSWFPLLPSYEAFTMRINRLSEAFRLLSAHLFESERPSDCILDQNLLDSMPIITCSGKRKGKVAQEITDKGYCSTKSMYYHGSKLHVLAFRREKQMPFPEQYFVTPASENDINLFKQEWGDLEQRTLFGDKIYINADYFKDFQSRNNSLMITPVKKIKGLDESLEMRDKAANDLFSKAVSKIRQPIESLFNWFIDKTDIQRASKVRSTKGLLVHIFGRIAAAYIILIFNS